MNSSPLMKKLALLGGIALLAVLPFVITSSYYLPLITTIIIYSIVVLGLDIVFGYTGEVSLGHAALVGGGAYTAGMLSMHAGLGFWWALPAAVVVTALFGALLALPALKVTGPYLAMVTLAFGTIVITLINEMTEVPTPWGHVNVTNGPLGIELRTPLFIDLRDVLDMSMKRLKEVEYYYISAIALVITVVVINRIIASHYGRAFEALRDSPIASDCMGVSVYKHKVLAFVVSAAFAGLAGVLYAYFRQYIAPEAFNFNQSIEFLLAVALSALGLGAFMLEARQRENALRLFQRAVEASDDSITIADARQPDFPLVYVNQKFLKSTGYSADEVLGHNCRFLSGPDHDQPGLVAVRLALRLAEPVKVNLRNYRKNGELYWNQLTLAPVFTESGVLTHFIGVQHDITEIKRTEDELLAAKQALEEQNQELEDRVQERTRELELLSTTDPLTGTRNRRFLMDQAELEIVRAQRYGHPLSCLLFDIDHFKRVNDHHGHDVGDRVLITMCLTVQAMLRPADTLARYGGEEFVVLLPETELEQARHAAERIRSAMETMTIPVPGLDAPLRVTVSIGVAALSVLHADADALLKAADTAMYRAKESGRNRVVVAGEDD